MKDNTAVPSARVIGWGGALPQTCLPNDQLPAQLKTSDEWISTRTGIKQRYIAASDETAASLGAAAARQACIRAQQPTQAIDLIICATSTPDHTFPATATRIQAELGCAPCPAFDIQAACSGFIYALSVANSMIAAGQAENALVIGTEVFSRILNWQDRATCVLFGDGAGALLLRASYEPNVGLLQCRLYADGRFYDELRTTAGQAEGQGRVGNVQMNGREVFRHAVKKSCAGAQEVLKDQGLTVADIDWLVSHQANLRILQQIGERLAIPPEKILTTIDRHANTSAASIPLALCHGAEEGLISPGAVLLLVAMGGGFTWGAGLLRW